jgi:hypothetical protein
MQHGRIAGVGETGGKLTVRISCATLAFVVILLVAGCNSSSNSETNPAKSYGNTLATQTTITNVKMDLLKYCDAEENYQREQSRYGSAEEIGAGSDALPTSRGPYTYSVELSGSDYKIVATLTTPTPLLPQTITADHRRQITSSAPKPEN